MWTNVFRIGELQTISWFQFLPLEPDPNILSDKSSRSEQRDAANNLVLSAHIQLQSLGFLSTWTNSFVGPWDPSQGVHNPDEKIKLWLFIPGRHSSIIETAQTAVSRLRVIGTGLWLAPGDSEEVSVALSQALRNALERAMRGLSYVRFGDVFTRCFPSAQSERNLRRAQPTVEFVFSATEEAIYAHVVVSAKYIRGLCGDDIEKILTHSSHSLSEGLPVIVSPSGMLGRLTGCCPSELVKQVYFSKIKPSNGTNTGSPYITQSPGCQLRGQSFYVEITLGCNSSFPNKESSRERDSESFRERENLPNMERTFIYPPESVVVPMMHRAFSRLSSKRFWIKDFAGMSLSEICPFWNFSGSFMEHCLALGPTCQVESSRNSSYLRLIRKHYSNTNNNNNNSSSNNSVTSSISSVSSTSSEEGANPAGADLEADADSLTARQTGLPPGGSPFENNGHKMGMKRPHADLAESGSQAGKADGLAIVANYSLDPNDANRGPLWSSVNEEELGMDIHILLSEFGDFGDFFENDLLSFGEPPGTAESQAMFLSSTDCTDISSTSPCIPSLDLPDQIPSFDLPTTHQANSLTDDTRSKPSTEQTLTLKDTATTNTTIPPVPPALPPNPKFEQMTKAEAMLTFAPEYAAVDLPVTGLTGSPFTKPYKPSFKSPPGSNSSSNTYVYSATSPSPPGPDKSEDKAEISSKLYTLVHTGGTKETPDKKSTNNNNNNNNSNNNNNNNNNNMNLLKGADVASSAVSGMTSLSSTLSISKKSENVLDTSHFLLSTKLALATETECITFQAAMCRVRHTLLSLKTNNPAEPKKRESVSVPLRIAGELDSDNLMQSAAQVGVWRSVSAPPSGPKGLLKPCNISNEEGLNANFTQQRQHLMDFLLALPLLVQQAGSFVDLALDWLEEFGPCARLALQEQGRRGFPCEPCAVHAGCGGVLASCHSVDFAGVDLVDPLAADVPASSMISLLQSDIKQALKSAFGNSEGPLPVIDWCRGRVGVTHPGDSAVSIGDGLHFLYGGSSDTRDTSSTVTLGGESMSPPQSTSLREGGRTDGSLSQRRLLNQETINSELEQDKGYYNSRSRPTLTALPSPSILVGYQDDWLKTSVSCLQMWEKAPLEPYALPKPVTYYAICPDVDLLTSAAVDFFQQLGTVYEICKLGTHSPHTGLTGQTEMSPGKSFPSGLVLVESPNQVKTASSGHLTSVSSISDFFSSLSQNWSVKGFVSSLNKIIKDLKLVMGASLNQKENSGAPCTVVYVICPFLDPSSVLQTLVESCVSLGSAVLTPSDRDRKTLLHSHLSRSLNPNSGADEPPSNILTLPGFSLPKLVLQVITADTLLRINSPNVSNELSLLKDIAFTVYNKARRVPRASSAPPDQLQAVSFPGGGGRYAMTGSWHFDPALRTVPWDSNSTNSSWPSIQRPADLQSLQELERKYLFEPLFILAEPGSVATSDREAEEPSDGGESVISSSSSDGPASTTTGGIHCCYHWTEDWRWLVCVWTDSRGELVDSVVFPFGGVSGRQDTKVLQGIFVQVLQTACQIINSSCAGDAGPTRPRDVVISRIGGFFELECQEWQKAIYSFGGNEVKKWPVQLRRTPPDIMTGTSLQQQEIGLIQNQSSLYSPHSKSSYMKGSLVPPSGVTKKPVQTSAVDGSRVSSSLQLVQSITLVGVSVDHSLNLILQADLSGSAGATTQSSSSSSTSTPCPPVVYTEGFSPVKPLGSLPSSFLLIPNPSLRYLSPTPLQLPTCLTSESPPLAHLLHSKGSAIPLSTGYIISKPVPPVRKELTDPIREEWPSVVSVCLIDHYGGQSNTTTTTTNSKGVARKQVGRTGGFVADVASREHEWEVLESVAAELHSLSWLTVSPVYADRRTALPFHCDMVLRLRRLLHYADKELSQSIVKVEQD